MKIKKWKFIFKTLKRKKKGYLAITYTSAFPLQTFI